MAGWEDYLGGGTGDALVKVGVFLLVQVLVYFILSKSSDVFSAARQGSFNLRTVRSVSIRRILAALSDLPAGGETSPPRLSRAATRQRSGSHVREDADAS